MASEQCIPDAIPLIRQACILRIQSSADHNVPESLENRPAAQPVHELAPVAHLHVNTQGGGHSTVAAQDRALASQGVRS